MTEIVKQPALCWSFSRWSRRTKHAACVSIVCWWLQWASLLSLGTGLPLNVSFTRKTTFLLSSSAVWTTCAELHTSDSHGSAFTYRHCWQILVSGRWARPVWYHLNTTTREELQRRELKELCVSEACHVCPGSAPLPSECRYCILPIKTAGSQSPPDLFSPEMWLLLSNDSSKRCAVREQEGSPVH